MQVFLKDIGNGKKEYRFDDCGARGYVQKTKKGFNISPNSTKCGYTAFNYKDMFSALLHIYNNYERIQQIRKKRILISDEIVKEIFKSRGTNKIISEKYNVTYGVVYRIKNKISWKHLNL